MARVPRGSRSGHCDRLQHGKLRHPVSNGSGKEDSRDKVPVLGKTEEYVPRASAHMSCSCGPTLPHLSSEVKAETKDTHFSSKAYGQRESKETKMDGRLQLDILQVMQRDYKLRSYSLNSVCAHFLGTSLVRCPTLQSRLRALRSS